jgi:hypothetical protein
MDPTTSPTLTDTGGITGSSAGSIAAECPDAGKSIRGAHKFLPLLVIGGLYLLLSVLIWWHVWNSHPSSSTICGCGDSSASIWYTAWPAYAISHGLNPLYSSNLGYPSGVNLVFAPFGIVLAPLTWLFGPVAALNVLLTLSPVVSALAMFALVRRWTSRIIAPFAAGLFYGFSPFIVNNLTSSHVDLGMLAIPPLIILFLDELLRRQKWRPVVTGLALGGLASLQFLVGTEVFIILVIEAAIALVLIVAFVAYQDLGMLRARARSSIVGLSVALATSVVLLAYPAWFAIAGPAHFSGTIHPGLKLSTYVGSTSDFLFPAPVSAHGAFSEEFFRVVGGYQGPVLSPEYFGLGILAVSVAGILIWRKDLLLWLFGVLALLSLLLATSSGSSLASLPVVKNIVPFHFVLFAYLSLAVVLGVVVDHTQNAVTKSLTLSLRRLPEGAATRSTLAQSVGALAAVAVAAIAILPPAAYLTQGLPITVERVVLPTWFQTVAPRLEGHPVVLALPAPFTAATPGLTWEAKNGEKYALNISGKEAAMTWQALSGQRFSMVGPGGLGTGIQHLSGENRGQDVITQVTFAYGSTPDLTRSDFAAVHRALSEWGVTTVVLPDQPKLPPYDQVASLPKMAALISAATGVRPVLLASAWVWDDVNVPATKSYPNAARYSECVNGLPNQSDAVRRADACVLAP